MLMLTLGGMLLFVGVVVAFVCLELTLPNLAPVTKQKRNSGF